MRRHKEPIKDIFTRRKRDKTINYGYTDDSLSVYLTTLNDLDIQALLRYCFDNKLYFDISAHKNELIIKIQQEKC
jgi:hypothetical protein